MEDRIADIKHAIAPLTSYESHFVDIRTSSTGEAGRRSKHFSSFLRISRHLRIPMVDPHLYICDWRITTTSCSSSGLLLRFPWTALASAAPSQAPERYSAARNTAKGDFFPFRLRMDKIQVENVHFYARTRTCRSLLDEVPRIV